jgi:class 3 adenylate cyclase
MNEPSPVRRLTTIVAIDVVGFSTLSARNEEHALGLLGARMAIAETYIKQHRGRVFKLTGDGLLAEFASPVEAVRAAVEIQEAMRTTNALTAVDDHLSLRIGANLGDVVESGDDLMGDAVNVAVRLESIAAAGGICVSAALYEQIVGKLTLGAEDMGEQQVKNIPRPIHAYRLTAEGASPVPPPGGSTARPGASAARPRLLLVGGALVAVAAAAVVGAMLLRDAPAPTQPPAQLAQATVPPVVAPAAVPPVAVAPPPAAAPTAAPRTFVAADIPFVTNRRRRDFDAYERAEGAKALAINVRGWAEFVSRRIDERTARTAALEACTAIVQKQIRNVRDYDRCMIYAVSSEVVWSFKAPAMPPQPYVAAARPSPPIALDPATVPLINEGARKSLTDDYLKVTRSKAFIIGRNRQDWWAPGDSDPEAIRRALQSCGHITGRACFVYAVGDQVVVQTPQKFRIVEVFTPQDLPGLAPAQQDAIWRYLVADDWRAIAVARNGRIGIASGSASEDAAVETALRECARSGGTECAVSAVGPFLITRN